MEFLTAYFANNERTVAKAIYVNDEGNEVPFVVSVEDGNPQWEKILEKLSLDQLHENTYKYIKQSEEDFKAQVMSIAKDRGMLIDIDERNTDAQKRLLDIIFNPDEDEKQRKESLFTFKLALFEFEAIKNSGDRETKAEIRKAEDLIGALEAAIKIIKQS